ncbi:MAG TPA: dihydrodipicolinate synthase family protein [Gemmatimonadales bacterium]|nr:dihydrodipicolinate synthase family protein [Gemmatimonadales bacterium]
MSRFPGAALRRGMVIPAHPLALNAARKLDERRQRALTRYYLDAGAGGIAVGVHTTQFAIRRPGVGLYRPVLELAAETATEWEAGSAKRIVRVAGVIGPTRQAVGEAETAAALGYHLGLLGLGALADASDARLIAHARAVGEVIPLMGFYLQPAVGGRILSYRFWRRFVELPGVRAIKVAPFNRYQTLDVVRAVADAGRAGDIALYTGNDDSILLDLLTPWPGGVRMVGGLLGHWAFWTRSAVKLHRHAERQRRGEQGGLAERQRSGRLGGHAERQRSGRSPGMRRLLSLALEVTDANGAIFDAANGFRGCIPGIHEILRRQGLLRGRWCLDPKEELSPGQAREIDRVCRAYPHLADNAFVSDNLDRWLS